MAGKRRTFEIRTQRNRRVKRGGMYPIRRTIADIKADAARFSNLGAPSLLRQEIYERQSKLGPYSRPWSLSAGQRSRPFGKQDKILEQLAANTHVPRNISEHEKRIARMLKKRTPAEIQRDREMNKQLSMRPLLPTIVKLQRQQELAEELRSIAPPNKKGEFDRLITQCDKDRELLKEFIRSNLLEEDGLKKMKKGHHTPLLDRNLSDIRVIGDLKNIIDRCSRNRIELMDIIRDVYPQLKDIMGASGLVKHGVAKYLEDPYQPGYNFVKGSLDKLLDDDDIFFVNPFEDDKQADDEFLKKSGHMDPNTGEWFLRSDKNSPIHPGIKYLGGSKKKRRTRKKSKRKTRKTRKKSRKRN